MPETPDTPNATFLQAASEADFNSENTEAHVSTMSTRDIADLTGKQHAHVMRDARAVLGALLGEGGLSRFGSSYLNGQNKAQPEYLLPKRESLVLVSGYDVHLRARIIDRWQELEARSQIDPVAMLNDPAAMRGILLSYTEKVLELQNQVEGMVPKVEAFERIAEADGSLCISDTAKTLGVRPKALFEFMRSHGWIFSPHGGRGDVAYQIQLQRGLMEHKTTSVRRSDGSEKIVTQARVTPKGLARLAQEFPPAAKKAA
jgi:phage antirepressor YoqD-like protein